ncbi:hypothetical protein [Pararhodobacter sp. SW119]|uniref:hypothetical protein n=1 Tax=Pararhodobacter sp. SW119 TaxID=2780075 RepID=UPI001ADF9EF0|nr:hypothetical protein [Pararhodobacter sp. SW119]
MAQVATFCFRGIQLENARDLVPENLVANNNRARGTGKVIVVLQALPAVLAASFLTWMIKESSSFPCAVQPSRWVIHSKARR